MRWMNRDPAARLKPGSLLASAKSVICCACKYESQKPKKPHVARFASGRDYHETVKEKLEQVVAVLKKERPDAQFKLCVDTSPVMEKALAVRSGIGWRGKNSVIIDPDSGSFFVLGEIITDIEIEPDPPIGEKCGDCRKCIDACPTRAIVEPYVLDSRRCISYLTIEHKGPIDNEFAKIIKNGQYGCDICQNVCPFNKGDDHDTA
jgi:epoxyqueuosine reductase